MTGSASQPPSAVVVRIDGHATGDRAVDAAISQARTLHRPLHLVFATGIGVVPWTPELLAARDRLTMRCHERAVALAPDLDISWAVRVADPAAMLVAASASAALVVLTESGLGHGGDVLLGGTTHKVVAHAHCPVMVVPRRGDSSDRGPVVVGVDIAEHSVPALAWAFAEASARGARLVAVHACWWEEPSLLLDGPPEDEPAWADIVDAQGLELSEMLAGWREKYPDVEVEPTVVHEHPAMALEDWSLRSPLLVVGSRGRGGFAGLLLGSVSGLAVHHAHCPVVVVPSRPRGPGSSKGEGLS